MPAKRTVLHTKLKTILGTSNVYYQPPETIKMLYPCIVYELADYDKKYANNQSYSVNRKYTVTCISKNPDSPIVDSVAELPLCSFDRHMVINNLYHDIFTIYL